MAVPKRKKSKSRRDMGRAHHRVKLPNLALCPECQEPIISHRICPECGSYRGKRIIKIKEES